jgi:cell division initiation protein
LDHIKPIDLDKVSFPRVFRGYDPEAVKAKLHLTSQEIEGLLNTQMQMRGEIDRLRSELQSFRGVESALKDALIVASKAADETRLNAHKEAETILASARQQAYEEQHVLASEVKSLMNQVDLLQKEKDRYTRQFRTLLEDHLKELDQLFTYPRAVVMTQEPETTDTAVVTEEPTTVEA